MNKTERKKKVEKMEANGVWREEGPTKIAEMTSKS